MTAPFRYDVAGGRVRFGAGSRRDLPAELEALGAARVVLIAGDDQETAAAEVAALLGPAVVGRFRDVAQHVPGDAAAAARALAAEHRPDAVVTIGGGSATGFGKAIRLALDVAFVAVPTTFAGSEMTRIWGLSGEGHKATGRDPRVKPDVVAYDPELVAGIPPEIAGPSGLNAIAHCVEALYAPGANPITAVTARQGLRALAASLPAVCAAQDDLEAIGDALVGACLAGIALDSAGTALHHKACHVLGGMFGLSHGGSHAVLLPHVLAYNAVAVPEAVAAVAEDLGVDDGPSGLRALAERVGAPLRLADLGMPLEGIAPAAEAIAVATADNPRRPDPASLAAMLEDAFHGRHPAGDRRG